MTSTQPYLTDARVSKRNMLSQPHMRLQEYLENILVEEAELWRHGGMLHLETCEDTLANNNGQPTTSDCNVTHDHSIFTRYDNTIKYIHGYFSNFEQRKCCLHLAGGAQPQSTFRHVRTDGLIEIETVLGTGLIHPVVQVESLCDQDLKAFTEALLCAHFPVLSAPDPPQDGDSSTTAPPIGTGDKGPLGRRATLRHSSDLGIDGESSSRGRGRTASSGRDSPVESYEDTSGYCPSDSSGADLAVIPPETMVDLLAESFGLPKRHLALYEKLAYEAHKRKSNAKVLVEDLMAQLSQLESNKHPYYNPKSFMTKGGYAAWQQQRRMQICALIDKFWKMSLPPRSHARQPATCYQPHYRVLLRKLLDYERFWRQLLRDDVTEDSARASGRPLSPSSPPPVVLSSASQRLLKEFALRYGVGVLYRQVVNLEYLASHLEWSPWFLDHVTLAMENLLTSLPHHHNKWSVVREEHNLLSHVANQFVCHCKAPFSALTDFDLAGSKRALIEPLIKLLGTSLTLKAYMEASKESPGAKLALHLHSCVVSSLQRDYAHSKRRAVANLSTVGVVQAPQPTPKLMYRLIIAIRASVQQYHEDFGTTFDRYFDLRRLGAWTLYSCLMKDMKTLCAELSRHPNEGVIDLSMLSLSFRLNQLDQQWGDFIKPRDQTWRMAFLPVMAAVLSTLQSHVESLVLQAVAADKFQTLAGVMATATTCLAEHSGELEQSGRSGSALSATTSLKSLALSRYSAFTPVSLRDEQLPEANQERSASGDDCESEHHTGRDGDVGVIPHTTTAPPGEESPAAMESEAPRWLPRTRDSLSASHWSFDDLLRLPSMEESRHDNPRPTASAPELLFFGQTAPLASPPMPKRRTSLLARIRRVVTSLASTGDAAARHAQTERDAAVINPDTGTDATSGGKETPKPPGIIKIAASLENGAVNTADASATGNDAIRPIFLDSSSLNYVVRGQDLRLTCSDVTVATGESNMSPGVGEGSGRDRDPHLDGHSPLAGDPSRCVIISSSLIDTVVLWRRLLHVAETLNQTVFPAPSVRHVATPETSARDADRRRLATEGGVTVRGGDAVTEVSADGSKLPWLKGSSQLRQSITEIMCRVTDIYTHNLLAMDLCAVDLHTAHALFGEALIGRLLQSRGERRLWGCRHMGQGQADCFRYTRRAKSALYLADQYEPLQPEMCTRINNLVEIAEATSYFRERLEGIFALPAASGDDVIRDSRSPLGDAYAGYDAVTMSSIVSKDVAKDGDVVSKDVAKDRDVVSKDVANDRDVVSKDVAEDADVISKDVASDGDEVSKDVAKKRDVVSKDVAKDLDVVSKDVAKDGDVVSEDVARDRDVVSKDVAKDGDVVSKDVARDGGVVSKDVAKGGDVVSKDVARDRVVEFKDVTKDGDVVSKDVVRDGDVVSKDVAKGRDLVSKDVARDGDVVSKDALSQKGTYRESQKMLQSPEDKDWTSPWESCRSQVDRAIDGLCRLLACKVNKFFTAALDVLTSLNGRSPVCGGLECRFFPLGEFLEVHIASLQEWLYPEQSRLVLEYMWRGIAEAFEREADCLWRVERRAADTARALIMAVALLLRKAETTAVHVDIGCLTQSMERPLLKLELYTWPTSLLLSLFHSLQEAQRQSEAESDSFVFVSLKGDVCSASSPDGATSDLGVFVRKLRTDLHKKRKCFSGLDLCRWLEQNNNLCRERLGTSRPGEETQCNKTAETQGWAQQLLDRGIVISLRQALLGDRTKRSVTSVSIDQPAENCVIAKASTSPTGSPALTPDLTCITDRSGAQPSGGKSDSRGGDGMLDAGPSIAQDMATQASAYGRRSWKNESMEQTKDQTGNGTGSHASSSLGGSADSCSGRECFSDGAEDFYRVRDVILDGPMASLVTSVQRRGELLEDVSSSGRAGGSGVRTASSTSGSGGDKTPREGVVGGKGKQTPGRHGSRPKGSSSRSSQSRDSQGHPGLQRSSSARRRTSGSGGHQQATETSRGSNARVGVSHSRRGSRGRRTHPGRASGEGIRKEKHPDVEYRESGITAEFILAVLEARRSVNPEAKDFLSRLPLSVLGRHPWLLGEENPILTRIELRSGTI